MTSPLRMIKEDGDLFRIDGLDGHWHKTLELPCGYQHFEWYDHGFNAGEIYLNDPAALLEGLRFWQRDDLYLYTQHEIFFQDNVLKHTRTSPNWEGGVVTYSTCKHLMRTYDRPTWEGAWLAGLCPKDCEENTALFVGRVARQFEGNYDLRRHLLEHHPDALTVKRASNNPRGDVYTPQLSLEGDARFYHGNFVEPLNHTRSIEFYKKSPGSTSTRPDGKIPKWWRDLEYTQRGRRPPSFILSPCYLFSRPMVWTSHQPRRAVLRLTAGALADSLTVRLRHP